MKNLLYVGNKLVSNKTNITTIDTLGNLLIKEGYTVNFTSSKQNKFIRLLDMLFSVVKHKKHLDYVLIDTYSTLNFYYAFFVSQLCRILNLKYIPILHGGDLPKRLIGSPKKSKMIFCNALKCVSPSHFIKEKFNEQGFTNIEYIPNSIEIVNYPFKKRREFAAKLLWVRSFKDIYNPLMVIKVAKQLINEGVNVSLTMVGPDADGTLLFANKLVRDLNLNVKITGKLTREEWSELSKESDIFINTSYFDNMPVSLIEAMALGLPIVSTNVGGIPSLVENNEEVILVEPDDVISMAKAVKNIISNPSNALSLVEKGRLKAEKFDWNCVKNQWKSLLK